MQITKKSNCFRMRTSSIGLVIKQVCCVCLVFGLTVSPAFAGSLSERFDAWLVGDDTVGESYGAMGDVSTKCMRCHDGTRGTEIALKDAEAPMQFRGFKNVNHPVGMDYDRYATRQGDEYTSSAVLPATIILENGRVGCISCHVLREGALENDPAGEEGPGALSKSPCMASGALTVGPTETALCLSCHRLE